VVVTRDLAITTGPRQQKGLATRFKLQLQQTKMAVSRAQETILETNEAKIAAQPRKTQRAQEMILRAMKALSAAQKQK